MLKVTRLPMVSVHEAAKQIAAELYDPNFNMEHLVFDTLCENLTDIESDENHIIRTYLPEDVDSYCIEYSKFLKMVKEATNLNWGNEFLADFE